MKLLTGTLLLDALAEAECFKHLHGPAGNTVSLSEKKRPRLLLNDPGFDIGKGRQLGRQG
jgi:hypothetical protein